MTPEVSLLVRAVVLSLLILGAERVVWLRGRRRAAQRLTVVRLPAEINPVVHFPSRPVEVSVVEPAKPTVQVGGQLKVVRLEPTPVYVAEKRAA